MLVLTRKRGQSIKIGNDIIVTVLEDDYHSARYKTIRLGIDAPKNVIILRTEITDRNQFSENIGNK